MEDSPARGESLHWYDISIAGKQFHIASRHGEFHIRRLEGLLERTFAEMGTRVEGKNLVTVALLAALNLADQLLEAEQSRTDEAQAINARLESWLGRLDSALAGRAEDARGGPAAAGAP